MNKGFVHLHVHTEYSLLDGLTKIKSLIKKVKEMGQTAVAITDHGVAYGAVKFFSECKAQGVKPIIGCEFYEAPGSRFEKSATQEEKYYHLILLVKNEIGYKNYCKLISRANTEGLYYKPRIDLDLLRECHEGLVCLSGCVAGRIATDIVKGQIDKAKNDIMAYKEIFGDDYYLEIQNHGIKEEALVAQELYGLSKELGVKLVCTNDCHYLNSDDHEAHEWLLCMQTKKTLDDPDRMVYEGDYSVKTEDEMRSLFPTIPEAFTTTVEIADKCNFEFRFAEKPSDYRMPKVIIPPQYGTDYFGYLEDITWEGYEKRYPEGNKYREQAKKDIEYELSIIKNMGFAEYFLDTLKTIKEARKNGILVGPGRGSGAGSRVNYCIAITDIDPIAYNLLFERFLNPERISMPDIDIDYEYSRKDDVIRSEAESNGIGNFCKIQTLGQMNAKSIVRDCCRVAGYPPSTGNTLAKMIGESPTLSDAISQNPDIPAFIKATEGLEKVWGIALKLEGTKKSAGTHACGHIPTPVPCEELFPCRVDEESGYLVCQYDMVEAEHLGNLKKDLLMLRNLTVIDEAQKAVFEHSGITVPLWTQEVVNDKAALMLFWNGETDGIFQFESEGMRKFMRDLKPDNFEDIIAGVSLYRPGPMDYIPKYVEGKHNPESITYDCPELEPILKDTYGVIVYQEQVMQIVRDLAGFSMGRADLIRKAMGKKKQEIIDAEEKNFVYGNEDLNIKGCIANGIPEDVAIKIYGDMKEFAKYAFNKSHAAAYAAISMQTAYLKAHYPTEFFAGLLSSVVDDQDKLVAYIRTCRKSGVTVQMPDINRSNVLFTPTKDNSIIFGLTSIKAVGTEIITKIVEERKYNGEYKCLLDMAKRVPDVNKTVIIALAKAGALDSFSYTRSSIISAVDKLLKDVKKGKKKQIPGQMNIFDMFNEDDRESIVNIPEYSYSEVLAFEKEVTGMYMSGHPMEEIAARLAKDYMPISKLDNTNDELTSSQGKPIKVAGIIKDEKTLYTKKDGSPMSKFSIEDETGEISVIAFPKTYAAYRTEIEKNAIVTIDGKINIDDDGSVVVFAEEVTKVENAPLRVYIQFPNMQCFENAQSEIEALRNKDSRDDLIVYLTDTKARKLYKNAITFTEVEPLLVNMLGSDNVKSIIC